VRRVVAGLADGRVVAGGEETYDIRPGLACARGDDGTPAVTAVPVREVVFDAAE